MREGGREGEGGEGVREEGRERGGYREGGNEKERERGAREKKRTRERE